MALTKSPTGTTIDLKFPKTVLIDTVSFCNLKCSMCPHVTMKRKKGRMEWSLYTKIIDEIAETSPQTRVWLVFFGEALLLKRANPSIFDMIKYAKNKGLKDVVLNSNGNLLDRTTSERLLDAGLDGLYVGIDAFSEETYNKLRVGGNYKQTVQNMLDFIDVLKQRGMADSFSVQVQFVEMDVNRSECDDFVKFWLSKGASVKIRQRLTWSGLVDHEEGEKNLKRHKCYWAMDTVSITDRGDVVTCAADPEGRYVLGNLREQSISDIWNGKMRELRLLHENEKWDELPFPCRDCKDWRVSYRDRQIDGRKVGGSKRALRRIKRLLTWWRV